MDRLGSILSILIWCGKGFCGTLPAIGVAHGSMLAVGQLIEEKGFNLFLTPLLSELMFPDPLSDEAAKYIGVAK